MFLLELYNVIELNTLLLLVAVYMLFALKNGENTHFYPKLAWPHATYDVISRYHRNRLSPNFTKMFLKDMLIIHAVEEIGEKPLGEWHPPRPLARTRLKLKKYKTKVLNSKSVKVACESHFWQIKVT